MQKDHRNGSEESQDDRYKEILWDNECPAMPCRAKSEGHREKKPFVRPPYNAAVARPVGKKEAAEDPDAATAVKAEWQRLRARKAWDESKVREWSSVRDEARRGEYTVHRGRLFCITVEKGSELSNLPDGTKDPRRKFKGRVVFQGNEVRDQNWDYAISQ